MVFVRFWRIVRVLNGTMVTVKSDANARVHKHKKRLEELIAIGSQNDELYNRMVEIRENNIWLNKQNMAIQSKQDAMKERVSNPYIKIKDVNVFFAVLNLVLSNSFAKLTSWSGVLYRIQGCPIV